MSCAPVEKIGTLRGLRGGSEIAIADGMASTKATVKLIWWRPTHV